MNLKLQVMKRVEDKVIVITGAGMGLGLATAIEAVKNGAKVSLIDYNDQALNEAKEKILKDHPEAKVLTVVADVSQEDAVKHYVDETVKLYSRIDGFYNNAGLKDDKL